MITLVVEPEQLTRSQIAIEGAAHRHLIRARRVALGEAVRLVDGLGHARWSRVVEVSGTSAILRVGRETATNEPRRRVELIVPPPKGRRLTWLVEKATEIGVAAIHLTQPQRAVRRGSRATLRRLSDVAVAAVQQSHRSRLPEITGMHRWSELASLLGPVEESWFLDPGERMAPVDPRADCVALIVGPEGGWTAAERDELKARGCRGLALGPTILRIETAAVLGSALLLRGDGAGSGVVH